MRISWKLAVATILVCAAAAAAEPPPLSFKGIEFGKATSHMNVDYDLFEGERSAGSVRHTFCRGAMVYDRGDILTQPGHGRFVARSLTADTPVRA